MPDFIDKDAFLKDVLPECEYPVKLMAAVERQPIVHIDDMTFKIQNKLQAANPSGVIEITFVKHGRWIDWSMWGKSLYQCSECNSEMKYKTNFCPRCGTKMLTEPPEEVQE